jgi:hypothetical protein
MSAPTPVATPLQAALTYSVGALKRVANYTLPQALDRRILDLGERKETLSSDERDELMAWVAFTQERSTEKFEAEAALRRLEDLDPQIATRP